MRRILLTLALLAVPALVAAQNPATSYEFNIYALATSAPQSRTPFPAADVVCNQAAPASTNTVNPTRVVWDDPVNAGRVCIWTPSGASGGLLVQLPVGAYEATVVAIDAAGAGAESTKAPFSRMSLQPARTGVKVIR